MGVLDGVGVFSTVTTCTTAEYSFAVAILILDRAPHKDDAGAGRGDAGNGRGGAKGPIAVTVAIEGIGEARRQVGRRIGGVRQRQGERPAGEHLRRGDEFRRPAAGCI